MPLPKSTKIVASKKITVGKNKCKIALFGTTKTNPKFHYIETREGIYKCNNKKK